MERKRRRKLDGSPPPQGGSGRNRHQSGSLRASSYNSENPSPFHLFERIPPSGKLPSPPSQYCSVTDFMSAVNTSDTFVDSCDELNRVSNYPSLNNQDQSNYCTSDDNEASITFKSNRFHTQSVQTHYSMGNLQELVSQLELTPDTGYEQTRELLKERDELTKAVEDLQAHLAISNNRLSKCLEIITTLLIEKSEIEHMNARRKCDENKLRLGYYTMQRQGASFVETWIEGHDVVEVSAKQTLLNKAKEEVEKERKILLKRKPSANKAGYTSTFPANNNPNSPSTCPNTSGCSSGKSGQLATIPPICSDQESSNDKFYDKPLTPQEWHEREEILRLRLASLRKDEIELNLDLEKFTRERHLHIRESKRLEHQKNSRFLRNTVVNNRYLLLSLLGKGGFSEVHKAFDTKELRYVACKVHQLNREWSEEKKANYIKHALRECKIHKSLDHPRIVRLFDVFEIDNNSFCTVLEYCDGNDLDFMLKQNKNFSEKESRSFVMQIISALKYLNVSVKPPVIHYDLKPGNIMVGAGSKSGEVKITDFGLSKQMDEDCYDPEHGMDLTSQGAGTYWYLPPEVFVQGLDPPKISSKVDVWSLGCIFFQCLYGKKPFGHNLSQSAILENNTILNAKEVQFPTKPPATNEAKAFIRKCLTYRVKDRPDILQLSEEDYVKGFFRRGTSSTHPMHNLSSSMGANPLNHTPIVNTTYPTSPACPVQLSTKPIISPSLPLPSTTHYPLVLGASSPHGNMPLDPSCAKIVSDI